MAIWERYQKSRTITNVGDAFGDLLLTNDITDNNFLSSDLVIVDGIITISGSTDNLCGTRLLVLDQDDTNTADENNPEPHHPSVYYTWFSAKGMVSFRLRSKKTLPPEHKLWLQSWKAGGALAHDIHVGLLLYIQLKH